MFNSIVELAGGSKSKRNIEMYTTYIYGVLLYERMKRNEPNIDFSVLYSEGVLHRCDNICDSAKWLLGRIGSYDNITSITNILKSLKYFLDNAEGEISCNNSYKFFITALNNQLYNIISNEKNKETELGLKIVSDMADIIKTRHSSNIMALHIVGKTLEECYLLSKEYELSEVGVTDLSTNEAMFLYTDNGIGIEFYPVGDHIKVQTPKLFTSPLGGIIKVQLDGDSFVCSTTQSDKGIVYSWDSNRGSYSSLSNAYATKFETIYSFRKYLLLEKE